MERWGSCPTPCEPTSGMLVDDADDRVGHIDSAVRLAYALNPPALDRRTAAAGRWCWPVKVGRATERACAGCGLTKPIVAPPLLHAAGESSDASPNRPANGR